MTCGPRMQISPISPSATSLPSSPRMAMSVEGNGRPNRAREGGAVEAVGGRHPARSPKRP